MASTSLRQVALASRPARASTSPLWTTGTSLRGTRPLSSIASTTLFGHERQKSRRKPYDTITPSHVSVATRSFSAWRTSKPAYPQRPSTTSSSLPSLIQASTAHLPPARHASTSTPSKPTSILKNPVATLTSLTPHENIYTIPNLLTFSRLLSAPLLGYLLLSPAHPPIQALLLFTYAGLTDLLDGFLARRLNQHTVVGSVIDPMADKSLMAICTFSLAWTGILPWWTATIILGRDVALAISAIWWRWISLPPPKTMGRYWDFSLPSAEVYPTEISKINTLLQLLLIGNAMVLPVLPEAWVSAWNLWGVFEGWCGLVAGTTVWSGLSYVGNKEAVKIVSQEEVRRVLEEREKKAKMEGEVEKGQEEGKQ